MQDYPTSFQLTQNSHFPPANRLGVTTPFMPSHHAAVAANNMVPQSFADGSILEEGNVQNMQNAAYWPIRDSFDNSIPHFDLQNPGSYSPDEELLLIQQPPYLSAYVTSGQLDNSPMWHPAVGNDGAVAAPKRRERVRRTQYSDEDWKGRKKTLEKLYINDGMSLKETMDCMKVDHNFNPPRKHYQRMFEEWGWFKNVKKSWMPIFQKIASERKRDRNKKTKFRLKGGRTIVLKDDLRTIRSSETLQEPDVNISETNLPPGVEIETPNDSDNSSSPQTAGVSPENILSDSKTKERVKTRKAHTVPHDTPMHESASDRDDEHAAREEPESANVAVQNNSPYRDESKRGASLHRSVLTRSSLTRKKSVSARTNTGGMHLETNELTSINSVLERYASRQEAIDQDIISWAVITVARLLQPGQGTVDATSFAALFAIIGRLALLGETDYATEFFCELSEIGESFFNSTDSYVLFLISIGKIIEERSGWNMAKQFFGKALSQLSGSTKHSRCCSSIQLLEEIWDTNSPGIYADSFAVRSPTICPLQARMSSTLQTPVTNNCLNDLVTQLEIG